MDRKNIFIVILGVVLIGAATFFIVYKFVLGNQEPVATNPSPAVTTSMPEVSGAPEETEPPATTEAPATETSVTDGNGQVILYNVDGSDRSKRLGGGVITLKNETSGESSTETFSENGEINLTLPIGKYTITEQTPADGYEPTKDPIALDVEVKEGEPGIPTISQEIVSNKIEAAPEVSTATAEAEAVAEATPAPEATSEETTAAEETTEATSTEETQPEETETPSAATNAQETSPNNPKTADITNKFNASFVYFVFAYGILAYSFVYIRKNILRR